MVGLRMEIFRVEANGHGRGFRVGLQRFKHSVSMSYGVST